MKTALVGIGAIALSMAANAQVIHTRAALNALLTSSTTDDFETYNIADFGAENLGVISLDSTTVANGQGPGLVNVGATYLDPSSRELQWNGHAMLGMNTKTILANGSTGAITINYSGGVQAMGLDAKAFMGFAYVGTMDVFNGAELLHTLEFSFDGTAGRSEFLGYENTAGITSVTLTDFVHSWSPIIDDHTYGVVPEPASIAALGLGALALLKRRRRKLV